MTTTNDINAYSSHSTLSVPFNDAHIPQPAQKHLDNDTSTESFRGLGRVHLAIPLHLRLTGAPLILGNGVHHRWNVGTAAPPSDLVCYS